MNVEGNTAQDHSPFHPFKPMFKSFLLASALIIAAPFHADASSDVHRQNNGSNATTVETKACWLSPECYRSLKMETSQLEKDYIPKTMKLFSFKVARR